MVGSTESETGTSYWFGAQLPVTDKGVLGLEYNHGSQYWRPFTYAEDTMIGSKIAARGDAVEAYFTYQLTDALSAQVRYTNIDYEYTGSNGFFGSASGTPQKIEDIQKYAAMFNAMTPTQQGDVVTAANSGDENAQGMIMAAGMEPYIVDKAQDFRFYLRYRF